MDKQLLGIHHVTAIAGDPQTNIDFYTGILGLRLVKLTVNFDDPATYHLYYGDGQGHPGTILTFFPWPGAMRGRIGAGQLTVTSFATPERSFTYWKKRLTEHQVQFEEARSVFDEAVLSFPDPDGLQLELISTSGANPDHAWSRGPVPLDFAIRGFHHVTLCEEGYERTASLLTETMGFAPTESSGNRFRYSASASDAGTLVDLVCTPASRPGRVSVGTVHHVAWRTPSDAQQQEWQKTLTALQYNVTPIIDRKYFHSIYFREPGGVLFEIATDPPGFAIDEPVDQLGSHLVLPPWLEPTRARIEQVLPKVRSTFGSPGTVTIMAQPELGFIHQFVPAAEPDLAITLLLLHGTGGSEQDLLPIGHALLPGAALLSPRGKVLENGMPRFFRRLAEGVFDIEDLKFRTHELADFVRSAAAQYGFQNKRIVTLGYSNGANIASSLMFLYPHLLAGAVLFRPMVLFPMELIPDLRGVHVLLAPGRRDPIVSHEQVDMLARMLEAAGADISLSWHEGGHELGQDDLIAAKHWLSQQSFTSPEK